MTIDEWGAIGIVCGAILAAYGVLLLIWKGIQVAWRKSRKVEDVLNQLLTNNDRLEATNQRLEAMVTGQANLVAGLENLTGRFEEHLALPHGSPGGQPAAWVQPKPNGPRPRPRT